MSSWTRAAPGVGRLLHRGQRLPVDVDQPRASSAASRRSATTTATASPTKRARSPASRWKFLPWSAACGGTIGSGRAASPRSAAVTTPTTPGAFSARVDVDGADTGVGVRAADDGGVEHARQRDVADVAAAPLDQSRILLAEEPVADELHRSGATPCPAAGDRTSESFTPHGAMRLRILREELGEDLHLVLGRVAAQARLARDAIGVDLGRRGAAALDGQPEVAVAAELDVLDHRGDGGLDVADRLGREGRRPRVQALPAERDVPHLVAQDQLHQAADGGIGRLVHGGLEHVDQDLLGGAHQAGEDPLQRGLGIERHAAHAVGADGAGRRRILRLREVAAQPLGHQPRGLGVPALLHACAW